MNKIIYIALTFLALTSTALATVWTDDFESYPVGYEIDNSPDWTNEGPYGVFTVDEDTGNKFIKDSTGTSSPKYGYTPPGEIADSEISFDFMFTGEDTYTSAHFRLCDSEYKGYIVSCCCKRDGFLGFGDYVMVGYYYGNGFAWYTPNIFFLNDYFDIDTWYSLKATMWGYPDVNYDVTVNGDLNYTGILESYPTSDGYCGVSVCSKTETVFVDNFEIDDDPVFTGIKSTTLGEIKASFR